MSKEERAQVLASRTKPVKRSVHSRKTRARADPSEASIEPGSGTGADHADSSSTDEASEADEWLQTSSRQPVVVDIALDASGNCGENVPASFKALRVRKQRILLSMHGQNLRSTHSIAEEIRRITHITPKASGTQHVLEYTFAFP
jgi:hypothetical protein